MLNENGSRNIVVWWVLWAAFLAGIPQFYFLLGSKTPTTSSSIGMAALALIPFFISAVIRWAVLPRMPDAKTAFTIFILGIAIAESVCFLGLFVFPSFKTPLVALSFLGIFQFAPYFAGKYRA